MNDEQQRMISDALDAGEEALARSLGELSAADRAEAERYAQDLEHLDRALALRGDFELDEAALAARIEAALDAELALPELDVLAPPAFEGEESNERSGPVRAVAPIAPVVALEPRPRPAPARWWLSGMAAAALALIGVVAGLSTLDGREASPAAMATSPSSVAPTDMSPQEAEEAEAAPARDDEAAAEGFAMAEASPEPAAAPPASGARMAGAELDGRGHAEQSLRAEARSARSRDELAGLEDRYGGASGRSSPRAASRPYAQGAAPGSASTLGGPAEAQRQDGADAVLTALRALEPQAQRCIGDHRALGRVSVRVENGRATVLSIASPFEGTPVAACLTRLVEGARLPNGPSLPHTEVSYRPAPRVGAGSERPNASRRRAAPAAPRLQVEQDAYDSPR